MVTLNHTKPRVVEEFLAACRASIDEIHRNPTTKLEGTVCVCGPFALKCFQAALYGMSQKIPDRTIVKEFAFAYLDACYSTPEINDVVDVS